MNLGVEDRVYCKENGYVIFIVKSISSFLDSSDAASSLHGIIWSSCVPPNVRFFAWQATWGKALVENNRIFFGLSPSFLVHYFLFFLYFILFPFCSILLYIYIYVCVCVCVSILCNTHSLIQ